MSIQKKIQNQFREALKNKTTDKIIQFELIKNLKIIIGEFNREPIKEISDKKVIKILEKLKKGELELIKLGKGSQNMIDLINSYLPEEVTEEEIIEWITKNVHPKRYKNKFEAMKPIMEHFGVRADGNKVKRILNDKF